MTADLVRFVSLTPHPLAFAAIFLVVGFLLTRLAFRERPLARFLCQLVSFGCFTAMLAVAGVAPFKLTPSTNDTLLYLFIGSLKIVWWLAAAWLLAGFIRAVLVFKRQPRETRFLQDLCAGLIYVAAVLAIIAYVFNRPVSGLLAASGVIAIVAGLALQNTLGDVFSGVVLNLAKPYHPGDWIIVDGGLQGRVIETNWRATQIITDSNDLALIPNSLIAKAKIVNASKPTSVHGLTIVVRLDPAIAPSRGYAVLEMALLNCNRILRTPAPTVAVRMIDAAALECEMQFFVSTIGEGPEAQTEIFDLVFRHCASANIRLAPPQGNSFILPLRDTQRNAVDMPSRLLRHLSIFASLSDDERAALEPKMKRRSYKAGDVVIQKGTIAPALFILSSGVLVAFASRGAEEKEVKRLAPGEFFGQGGVLTGAAIIFDIRALSKAVVYEIAKDDLAPLLKERPAIATELGQILARLQAADKARLEELAHPDRHNENLAARLAERVKYLFGLA
jgi:small-conductance mechanosensitive channel/CRP-like cAMP-binding protein